MPFIDTCDSDALPTFYNVVRAVGQDSPNKLDDVRLVQYLLQLFYTRGGYQPPKGNLTVDGICGPITKNWILKFQLDVRAMGYAIQMDKRVDRARNHQAIGASNTVYTLVWLNYMVQSVAPDAWAGIPSVVPMVDAASAPPPSNDYVPEYSSQRTSPGGPARGQSSSVIPASGGI